MTTVNRQHLLIPYGISHWDDRTFSATAEPGGAFAIDCRARFVVIDPENAKPLRLNNSRYEFAEPPNMRLLPTAWHQLTFLEDHLLSLCGPWAKHQHLFIARYFDFIRLRVEEERTALAAAIEAFGNLYEYRDWVFSALRPLPQAYIYAPRQPNAPDDDAVPKAEDFVATEVAFWTGTDLRVIDLSDPHSTDPFQRKRLERIERAGVSILAIPPAALEDGNDAPFRRLLPEAFANYWVGELAPSRPFVDTKLGDIALDDIGF